VSTQILTQGGDAPGAKHKGVALKVVVVSGPDEGAEAPLDGPCDIGSDPDCRLVLRDPAVSRKHLVVSVTGGRIMAKDLGSKNGTSFQGARIKEAELPLGAVLTVGKSQIAVFARWFTREVPPSNERRFGELLGEAVAMREVFAMLERVAPSDVTVLVEGESGTGKELVARSLHAASPRAKGPYVVFDCGSVPHELAESELFGHKRGAFSGAVADRLGAFQRADGGTICLDELGELPLELQPKLLRVLETGEVRPVGEDAPRKIDVRVIAATNRDLHAEVHRGRFRSDLLYRLEVVKVRIPPLRSRPEDIPLLVTHLLKGKLPESDAIEGPNLAKLIAYSWPGNVRELRNILQRAVTLAQKPGEPPAPFAMLVFILGRPGDPMPTTLGGDFPGVASPMEYKDAKALLLANFDRAYVTTLLERHENNIQRAADAAGLSRKHIYEMLRRLDEGELGEDAD
jgi:DNA-binding NtrC family response regulator